MLPPLLKLFGQNATYFTFNVFQGILYPVVVGGILIAGTVLALLLVESRLRLMRFWLARVVAAAVLVNLGVAIFFGAVDMDLAQLLAKVGPGENPAKYRDKVRDLSNATLLIFLFLATRRPGFVTKLYRFFVVFVAVSAALATYRATPAVLVELAESWRKPARVEAEPARSVVWVIFDELDQEELGRAPSARLPNFQRLQASGLSVVQARSPSARTLTSLPQLLAGGPLTAVQTESRALIVVPPGGEPMAWRDTDNVFKTVQSKHGPVQVVGFYHPYCRHFPEVADCQAYAISNMPGLATFLVGASHTITLSQSRRILRWFGVDARRYELTWTDQMGYITRMQLDAVSSGFRPGTAVLHFLHLNVPHLPRNKFGEELLHAETKRDPHEDPYQFNLRLADHFLGRILQRIDEAPPGSRTLLIVSGDHGRRPPNWREKGMDESADAYRHVPFILWTKDGRGAGRLEERVDTTVTRALIERYLAGELDSLEDARSLFFSTTRREARPGTPRAIAR
jgi:hypothetical protein